VRVDLYRDDRTLLTQRVLNAGDVILLSTGGQRFEVLEEWLDDRGQTGSLRG
jgi:hypothetical protein